MTALLGKTLLFAGCTAFGLLRGSRLRQRTACLGEFRRTLAGLARELAFSLRPVSDLMASAEAGTQGPTAAFFRTCRRRFAEGGQESWAESWTAALEQVALPLEEADLRLLQEAGDVLGRYDGESQRQAGGTGGGGGGDGPPALPGLSGAGPCSGAVLPDPPIKLPGIDKLGCA